jgi:hypothetical protein
MRYFRGSLVFTVLALGVATWLGSANGGGSGALRALFIVGVLGVLEVSLSFENAVVDATVLRGMSLVWRRRFLTWGMLIGVAGMRVVFPLVIVAVLARISPLAALSMAIGQPEEYARVLGDAHVSLSAFGGAFLAMVGLKHFVDAEKEVFWLRPVEEPMSKLGRMPSIELAVVLLLVYAISGALPETERLAFVTSGMMGLVVYIGVDGVGALLGDAGDATAGRVRTGLAAFLYLETLDASFSFDGVIGALALTTNLAFIALGLGIGAMFVRSLCIFLVEKGTLTEYRYLEAGAFWAILALAGVMFTQAVVHVPEVVTGLVGASFILVAFASSVRYKRKIREVPS